MASNNEKVVDETTYRGSEGLSLSSSHIDSDQDVGDQADRQGLLNQLTLDTRDATNREHSLTVKEAIRDYKKAIFWSFIVTMAIVMEAYDTLLVGSFIAYPSFQRKFGKFYPHLKNSSGGYQIEPHWQVALPNAKVAGMIIGCIANGYLADRFGRKRALMGAYVWQAAAVFALFFAPNIQVLCAGFALAGVPQGLFAIMAPTYACEVCPVTLRTYVVGYINLCWVVGHLIASALLNGLVGDKSQWGYRIPFAVQWVWPLPLFVLMVWCPESPWWLVRRNRLADAERSLRQLRHPRKWPQVPQTLAMMVHTNAFELQSKTQGSWLDCFRGVNGRRTEISILAWTLQLVPGFVVSGSTATYFFEQAGLQVHDAFKLTLGAYAVQIVGNVASWFLMAKVGRRPLYIWGMASMGAVMLIIGILGVVPASSGVYWTQAVLLIIWFLLYSLTVGPLAFIIAAEVPAAHQRAKTLALARDAYYIASIVNDTITPYILNPTAGNLKGKAAFIPFGLAALSVVWSFFRLPETKNRTFGELDMLFESRASVRKFETDHVSIHDVDAKLVSTTMVEKAKA